MLPKVLNLEPKRKDVILNAALKEFATKGFDDASTNVIAKESGISKGLMFHYVNSKKNLFLFLYDYCTDMINKEYLDLMNFDEQDIFEKLRQSYLLQIELLQKHPWIFEFIKITATTKSDEINKELEGRVNEKLLFCQETMFDKVDESKFREGLDVERSKQLIFWSNIGFTNQILEDIRSSEITELDYDNILAELDGYLNELRKIFYK
ncbi:transcriptional regulator, TetR family [Virgibacillus subterraneus]|uniref:Transcriptional regulator, TetR family n=2 Tax=Virgibacillus TaxID=84406 RepID=A0A1H1ETV7_9BACI|nr:MULTISPECIES: TetR/AcrR family transcriptional regulator [Virgibacillus]SDQ92177.1 transcriptional regulator, TetR family [Virgibacillus salinus]SEQ47536.1 transcriptional regulator, TetR family [Virgibacillus subterraneus]